MHKDLNIKQQIQLCSFQTGFTVKEIENFIEKAKRLIRKEKAWKNQ